MKPFLQVLHGESVFPPPVWLMRQAGRYLPEYRALRRQAQNFLQFCYTPELAAEATLQPIRRFGFDAAILFADILVIPDALGQKVAFVEGEGPKLSPLQRLADIDALTPEAAPEKLRPIFATLRQTRAALPRQTALIGFAGAPWTVAAYMLQGEGGGGFPRARVLATQQPVVLDRLLDMLVQVTADYLIAQVEHGAEAVQLFDSWAGLVPEGLFDRLVISPTRRIVRRFRQSCPDAPIIGFPRAVGSDRLQRYIAETGVSALSLGEDVSLSQAAALQKILPVQGNLAPDILLAGGAELRRSVAEIVNMLGRGPFIFNLGHGVNKDTPPDHVAQLLAALRASAAG